MNQSSVTIKDENQRKELVAALEKKRLELKDKQVSIRMDGDIGTLLNLLRFKNSEITLVADDLMKLRELIS